MDSSNRSGPDHGHAVAPYRARGGIGGWRVFGITMGVLVAAAVAVNIPDLIRYFRIRNM